MIITITLNAALDRTQRIEHPLQVGKLNRAVSSHLEPGGKGINVSRAIKALGGSSIALGFSAGTNGRIMKDMLTAADIHHDFVDIAGQLRVNTQIIDAQGGHTEVNEPGNKLDDSDFMRLLDRIENYLDEGNIFVLSGSTPPEFPLKNYRKLCKTIKKLKLTAPSDILEPKEGKIMKIDRNGRITTGTFTPHTTFEHWWRKSPFYRSYYEDTPTSYDDLFSVAKAFGVTTDEVQALLDYGCSEEEIEEMLYDPTLLHEMTGELLYAY